MNRRKFLSLFAGAATLPLVGLTKPKPPIIAGRQYLGSFPLRLNEQHEVLQPVDLKTNQFNPDWVNAPYEVVFITYEGDFERLAPTYIPDRIAR